MRANYLDSAILLFLALAIKELSFADGNVPLSQLPFPRDQCRLCSGSGRNPDTTVDLQPLLTKTLRLLIFMQRLEWQHTGMFYASYFGEFYVTL